MDKLHNVTLTMILLSTAFLGMEVTESLGKSLRHAMLFFLSILLWTPFYKIRGEKRK